MTKQNKNQTRSVNRREFIKMTAGTLLGFSFLGVIGATPVYARWLEPRWVVVTHLSLTLPRLNPVFKGLRIVHISDIHANGWMNPDRIKNIVEKINLLEADVVVITGDFVSFDTRDYSYHLTAPLLALTPKLVTLGVLGNHDHWSDASGVRKAITEAGVIELANDVYSIERNGATLHIAGVDDFWVQNARLDKVLQRLPAEGAAILLAHEPDFADTSALSGRFDLQLSGHSHGGQVVIPGIGAPILPKFARKYPSGLYDIQGMQLYTNRGLGCAEIRVRFNCPPEITVITLAPGKSG